MKKFTILFVFFSFIIILSCGKSKDVTEKHSILLAPASPASIPLILACRNVDNVDVMLFTNHTKAHASFLRGDADFIATGYNVGVNFRKNNSDIRIISSLVSELSYLVSVETDIDSLYQLESKEVNLPFKGSPIEKLFDSIIKAEKKSRPLEYNRHYLAFPSTVELIKKGDVKTAVLPEPFVSLLLAQKKINSYVSLQKRFKYHYQTEAPQLALFTRTNADSNKISKILYEIDKSIQLLESNPEDTIASIINELSFPENIVFSSVQRIGFQNISGTVLKKNLIGYHKIMGDDFAPQESFVIITEK